MAHLSKKVVFIATYENAADVTQIGIKVFLNKQLCWLIRLQFSIKIIEDHSISFNLKSNVSAS